MYFQDLTDLDNGTRNISWFSWSVKLLFLLRKCNEWVTICLKHLMLSILHKTTLLCLCTDVCPNLCIALCLYWVRLFFVKYSTKWNGPFSRVDSGLVRTCRSIEVGFQLFLSNWSTWSKYREGGYIIWSQKCSIDKQSDGLLAVVIYSFSNLKLLISFDCALLRWCDSMTRYTQELTELYRVIQNPLDSTLEIYSWECVYQAQY